MWSSSIDVTLKNSSKFCRSICAASLSCMQGIVTIRASHQFCMRAYELTPKHMFSCMRIPHAPLVCGAITFFLSLFVSLHFTCSQRTQLNMTIKTVLLFWSTKAGTSSFALTTVSFVCRIKMDCFFV